MIIIIIINYIRIRRRSCITGTNQSVCPFIPFMIHLRGYILHQGTVNLTHLFGWMSRWEGCNIRPKPKIEAIVFIHLISANTFIQLVLFKMFRHDLFCFRH